MTFSNVLYNTDKDRIMLGTFSEANKNRKRRKITFDEDIDDVARAKHAEAIGVDEIYPIICDDGMLGIDEI